MTSVRLNTVWILIIVFKQYNRETLAGQIAVFVMFFIFFIFAIVDFLLMWLHAADRTQDGRLEYDYFYGNAFFIDLPIMLGVLVAMLFSHTIITNDSAIITLTKVAQHV
jgi:hypothetical protein